MDFATFAADHGASLSKEAGEHVFSQGDDGGSLYVVKSGLLKAYYLSRDGNQRVKSFFFPGEVFASLAAVHTKAPCSYSTVCLQRTKLIKLDFAAVYAKSRQDIAIAAQMVDFLLAFAMKKERREYEFLCLSPEERYESLLATRPELFDLVSQNELALYLGVTPESLSRIKSRMRRSSDPSQI